MKQIAKLLILHLNIDRVVCLCVSLPFNMADSLVLHKRAMITAAYSAISAPICQKTKRLSQLALLKIT